MLVDGRKIANEIVAQVRDEVSKIGRPPTVAAITLAPTSVTRSYLKIKIQKASDAGMHFKAVELPEQSTTADVIEAIEKSTADAIIVQLPLPKHIDTQRVVDSIPLHKDADVLSSLAYEKFKKGEEGALVPPVADAVEHVLKRYDIPYQSEDVAVVGEGRLVGEPVATLLRQRGARVTTLNVETFDSNAKVLKNSSIVISGVGKAGLITTDMLGEGQVLIDAGTSESNGALAGDADPACAQVTKLFTPVPGGVGPIAVACLFRNICTLYNAPV